ncbi:MAG: hypothetical protein U9Q20_01080, partial [Campylobacterota bacterium]|nr:hypothetical protein [Campylobacterota bacterium]
MNKILIIFIMISSILYAKKDFYYSYINPDLTQISDEQKQKIINGNGKLDTIRRYLKEGQLGLALKEIEIMKHNNKIEILTSDILLLNSRILYNLDTKKRALEALDILEVAVNESKINQNNLLEAYELLVLLNIRINKIKEAEYYAKVIATSFDDPVSKIHGKIALAQIHIKKREYRTAIKILKQELVEATNLETATIIADELYDALILNKEKEEAYTLSKKVLEKNIDYYANDSYKALKKVNKLLAAKMPEFAINIINRLLENSKDPKSIKNFKFILANTYMDLAGYEKKYLPMAKEIYKDLIQSQEDNPYFKRSKMYLDEIIMREGKFDPQMIAAKYSGFESMQYKAMMQELLNAIDDEKYEQVIRMKKVYSGIYKEILNRYGYESIDQIYTIVNFKMLQYYLRNEQCEQLNTVIKELTDETLLSIIEDDNATDNLFNCMQELPENRVYLIAKNVYSQSLNP